MKIVKPLAIAFFSLLLLSCEDSDDPIEIDFEQTITTTLNIDITEETDGQPLTFSATDTIDFTTVQEIQENIEDIQNATIDALFFEIDNFNGMPNTTVNSASINFNDTTIEILDINLEQADNDDTLFPIEDQAALTAIEDALQNDDQATVTLFGTINSAPARFDVIIYLDVTVTSGAE